MEDRKTEGSWDTENTLFLGAGSWLCSICKESVSNTSGTQAYFYLLHLLKFFNNLPGQILYKNFNVYSKQWENIMTRVLKITVTKEQKSTSNKLIMPKKAPQI